MAKQNHSGYCFENFTLGSRLPEADEIRLGIFDFSESRCSLIKEKMGECEHKNFITKETNS